MISIPPYTLECFCIVRSEHVHSINRVSISGQSFSMLLHYNIIMLLSPSALYALSTYVCIQNIVNIYHGIFEIFVCPTKLYIITFCSAHIRYEPSYLCIIKCMNLSNLLEYIELKSVSFEINIL